MSLLSEFKEFAMKGNVVDMAVGIVIGAAFGKIVSAFVDAVVMPALGWVIGGVDFSSLAITLGNSVVTGEPVTIGYGKFIEALVDFLIIAAANASRVRFRGAPACATTLSSTRMPPKGLSASTRFQSIALPRPSARAAASSESMK